MTLSFLRALCLRYPITAGTKIGPMTKIAIGKVKKEQAVERLETLKKALRKAFPSYRAGISQEYHNQSQETREGHKYAKLLLAQIQAIEPKYDPYEDFYRNYNRDINEVRLKEGLPHLR